MGDKTNLIISEDSFLNKNFFKNIVKKDYATSVDIKSISLSKGCSGGDNYCSFIYRAEIIYTHDEASEEQKTSFIIKSMPTDGTRTFLADLNIFEKECHMYMKVIPKMEKIIASVVIGPKCFYSTSEPIKTIVMEDLTKSGYKILDRIQGFDEVHAGIVLERLGQFHAASMILAQKDPNIVTEMYTNGLYNSISLSSGVFHTAFQANFVHLAELIKEWPGYENIAKKLKKLEDQFLVRAIECTRLRKDSLNVINHGDFWINNILFNYKERNLKKPTSVKLIDFQGCIYGSPALDIHYFLCTSLELHVLINRRDSLIENHYYKSFRHLLEKSGCTNIPTLDEIFNELKLQEYFGFFTSISVSPFIFMERADSEDNSLEGFADPEVARKKCEIACSTKRYQDMLKYMLKRCDQMGILDV